MCAERWTPDVDVVNDRNSGNLNFDMAQCQNIANDKADAADPYTDYNSDAIYRHAYIHCLKERGHKVSNHGYNDGRYAHGNYNGYYDGDNEHGPYYNNRSIGGN